MAARDDVAVRVEGLKTLRSDLRAISKAAPREVGKATKDAATKRIVPTARREAPKGATGRLAARTVAAARGDKTLIRNPLPYANPIHWGWPKRAIKPRTFITAAVEEESEAWAEDIGDALEQVARKHGFK